MDATVADHGHGAVAALEFLGESDFVLREQLGVYLVQPQLPADSLGSGCVIAREHDEVFDPLCAKLCDGCWCFRADRVFKRQK